MTEERWDTPQYTIFDEPDYGRKSSIITTKVGCQVESYANSIVHLYPLSELMTESISVPIFI